MLSIESNVESRDVVSPESEGKFSNPSSSPLGELYIIISSGSFKDAICCSDGETGSEFWCGNSLFT